MVARAPLNKLSTPFARVTAAVPGLLTGSITEACSLKPGKQMLLMGSSPI